MIIILLIIYFSLFSLFKFEISISAIYILILKDFRTVTLRTDTTDTPTHRDASHLKIGNGAFGSAWTVTEIGSNRGSQNHCSSRVT